MTDHTKDFEKSLAFKLYTASFKPGDRVRNWAIPTMLGTVIDDEDTEHGTIALTYDGSSQVWYVAPEMLELVATADEESVR